MGLGPQAPCGYASEGIRKKYVIATAQYQEECVRYVALRGVHFADATHMQIA